MQTVVITGASTGIGRATAGYLAHQGWRVFAGVRKENDAKALGNDHENITALRLDVTDEQSISAAMETVSNALQGETLCGLVNNAGIAFMGPLALQPMSEIEAHFRVNILGAIAVTQAFAPLLGMDRTRTGAPGRIINISSAGGLIAGPFVGAYTATKHALEGATDTFRRELMIYGIDAIVVGPGAVKTPIWEKADEKNEARRYASSEWAGSLDAYADTLMQAGEDGFSPEKIAHVIETALTDPRPKARYAPVPNKLTNFTIPTRLPKRWLDGIFASRFGMKKPA
ncbi:MAG: SDR family NAD(P)-dependent oxidoreductase [Pseudomonadota bacterium]